MNHQIKKYYMDKDMDYLGDTNKFKPNLMQNKELKELARHRDMGNNKALVVSETGSGKTILAALDVRNCSPTRLLFIAHKDAILIKTMEIFKTVFGSTYSYGLFTGNEKNIESDMIFATNITMAKNIVLFNKNDFDYIILDECHRICRSEHYRTC